MKIKTEFILINNHAYYDFVFPQLATFTEVDFGPVELQAGDNLIRVIKRQGDAGLAIDYFRLEQIFE